MTNIDMQFVMLQYILYNKFRLTDLKYFLSSCVLNLLLLISCICREDVSVHQILTAGSPQRQHGLHPHFHQQRRIQEVGVQRLRVQPVRSLPRRRSLRERRRQGKPGFVI